MKFTVKEALELIKAARSSILSQFKHQKPKLLKNEKFNEKSGVFVTILSFPDRKLRGCIGYAEAVLPLITAVNQAAWSAAFTDVRFPPLSEQEIDKILIEISILTKPKLVEKPFEKNIQAGKDGLICKFNNNSGLLLPQVAIEHNLQAEQFLECVCEKAGLSSDTWKKPDCQIYKFQAQIFAEEEPNGKVVEKKC